MSPGSKNTPLEQTPPASEHGGRFEDLPGAAQIIELFNANITEKMEERGSERNEKRRTSYVNTIFFPAAEISNTIIVATNSENG